VEDREKNPAVLGIDRALHLCMTPYQNTPDKPHSDPRDREPADEAPATPTDEPPPMPVQDPPVTEPKAPYTVTKEDIGA
jgi:hypothetical protein